MSGFYPGTWGSDEWFIGKVIAARAALAKASPSALSSDGVVKIEGV